MPCERSWTQGWEVSDADGWLPVASAGADGPPRHVQHHRPGAAAGERGIQMSASWYRLVTGIPERLNLQVFAALCDILDSKRRLFEPVVITSTRRKTAGNSAAACRPPGEARRPAGSVVRRAMTRQGRCADCARTAAISAPAGRRGSAGRYRAYRPKTRCQECGELRFPAVRAGGRSAAPARCVPAATGPSSPSAAATAAGGSGRSTPGGPGARGSRSARPATSATRPRSPAMEAGGRRHRPWSRAAGPPPPRCSAPAAMSTPSGPAESAAAPGGSRPRPPPITRTCASPAIRPPRSPAGSADTSPADGAPASAVDPPASPASSPTTSPSCSRARTAGSRPRCCHYAKPSWPPATRRPPCPTSIAAAGAPATS